MRTGVLASVYPVLYSSRYTWYAVPAVPVAGSVVSPMRSTITDDCWNTPWSAKKRNTRVHVGRRKRQRERECICV